MKEHPILFNGEMARAILEGRKTQTRRVIKPWPPKIALPQTVRSDLPFMPKTYAKPGIYRPIANPQGALSVEAQDGRMLGVKPGEFEWVCPYGQPGDRLWVRETWKPGAWRDDGRVAVDYKASPDLIHTPWIRPHLGEWAKYTDRWFAHLRDINWPVEDSRYKWEAGQSPFPWTPSIHMPRWASRITLEVTGVRVERVQEIKEKDARAEGIAPKDCKQVGISSDKLGAMITYPDCVSTFARLWDTINAPRGHDWDANPWVWVVEFRLLDPPPAP